VWLSLLLVGCVVLAGCGGAPTGSTPTGTMSGETTTGTATASPTQTVTMTETTDDEAALEATTLTDRHRSALRDRSYEARFSFSVDLPNGTAGIAERRIVDRASGLALDNRTTTLTDANSTSSHVRTRFTTLGNGTTYERLGGTDYATVYSDTDGDGTSTTPIDASDLGGSVVGAAASVDWTRAGTETVDGVTVTRYEATGPESVRQFREATDFGESALNRVETAETASATLLVDEDSVVRQFSLTLAGTTDGQATTVTLDVAFSNVGSATVDPPAWLNDAKQNT